MNEAVQILIVLFFGGNALCFAWGRVRMRGGVNYCHDPVNQMPYRAQRQLFGLVSLAVAMGGPGESKMMAVPVQVEGQEVVDRDIGGAVVLTGGNGHRCQELFHIQCPQGPAKAV